ncbi:hypothetical protein CsSME_00023430 [Camellia sinensis var. sinensis]
MKIISCTGITKPCFLLVRYELPALTFCLPQLTTPKTIWISINRQKRTGFRTKCQYSVTSGTVASNSVSSSLSKTDTVNLGRKRGSYSLYSRPSLLEMKNESMENRARVYEFLRGIGIVTDELDGLELPVTIDVMRERVDFLHKLGLTIEDINNYPLVLGCSVKKNMIPVLDYLGKLGVRKSTFTEFLRRYPQVLHASVVVDLEPVVKYLQGMDIKPNDIPRVLEKYPEVMGFKLEGTMSTSVAYLVGIGVARREIGGVLTRYPEILGMRVGRVIKPFVEYLENLGIPRLAVARLIEKRPHILGFGLEERVKPNVESLLEFNVRQTSLASVIAQYPEIIGIDLKPKLHSQCSFLRSIIDLGPEDFGRVVEKMPQVVSLSQKPIVKHMVLGCPQILALNLDIMKLGFDYFQIEMGRCLDDLVIFPAFFTYSLESTIKPRHKMVAKKGLKCSLAWLLNCSDEKFAERMNYDFIDMDETEMDSSFDMNTLMEPRSDESGSDFEDRDEDEYLVTTFYKEQKNEQTTSSGDWNVATQLLECRGLLVKVVTMAFELSSVLSRLGMVSTSNHASVVSMNLFVALLCACIVIGHLLEESRWMNESTTALVLGLCTGSVILLTSGGRSSHVLVFSEDLFFIYLLPPIIFNAGFQVKKKQFFRNFITITLFGAVGTIISWVVISVGVTQVFKRMEIGSLDIGDYLAIGAIFSATDSVCTLQVLDQDETPLLYSLVFGEGVVNDATSVVLFNAIQSFDVTNFDPTIALQFLGNFSYLFVASTLLGVLTGLLSAYIIKKLYFGRHSTDREVALMILMAYLSYMMAELFYLSGILTVFFCGIVMSHYTWHNVTESSRITTKYIPLKISSQAIGTYFDHIIVLNALLTNALVLSTNHFRHAFATLSFVAEIFIFLYVGMDALDIEKWRFVNDSPGISVAVSSILLCLILAGRAAFVFPLSFLSNLAKKNPNEKIEFKQQVTIWWAGLMRGAVSMALAYNKFTSLGHTHLRGNAIMITSTITVVLFSTVVFGLLTKPLVRLLLPPKRLCSTVSSDLGTPKSSTMPLLEGRQDSEVDLDGTGIPRPNSLRLFLSTPTHTIHRLWRKFDDTFMRPVFGGRGFVPYVPCSPTERNEPGADQ